MAKLHVLNALYEMSNVTAREVADALGIEPPAAGMALLRLIRQGLATRQEGFSPTVYALTDKGMQRLRYLASQQPAVCNVCGAPAGPQFRGHQHLGCSGMFC
jgi:DNA-binding MarR family transcriptional regulator